MAEDLTDYLNEAGVRVRYLHSDIETLERVQIIAELRRGVFDVLVGINLLREGLDLPEVALVAILDADKEGFLRSERSLIQTIGRAARHVEGRAILFADHPTPALERAISETQRRRELQLQYNADHGITPRSIEKVIREIDPALRDEGPPLPEIEKLSEGASLAELPGVLADLRKEMLAAAQALEFERAALLRDRIREIERVHLRLG
jgi:excinuclease ABC subunit B